MSHWLVRLGGRMKKTCMLNLAPEKLTEMQQRDPSLSKIQEHLKEHLKDI